MYLSQNFTLDEFIRSSTADRLGIDNNPEQFILPNLRRTAEGMEQVRSLLGNHPIRITSGFRSPELNNAVGSKSTSQHTRGLACDFLCPDYGLPEDIVHAIVKSKIEYDQCIFERMTRPGGINSWVHVSFTEKGRKQALVIDDKGTRAWA